MIFNTKFKRRGGKVDDHQRALVLTFHKYSSRVFVIGESCSSKYLNFNLLGKEVRQKPMNQHLEECLSLILLMADSLIICKTAAEILDHGKDLKEDISKYKPQAASKT